MTLGPKIILLMSGGLDSTTALYHYRALGHEIFPMAINYGQRHRKELRAAEKICRNLNLNLEVADLSQIQKFIATSSQTNSFLEVPEGHYAATSMKLTVVPNRNMIMLSVAIGWAVSLKAQAVAYAAHSGDHTIYPDCRPEFIEAMREAAQLCDWEKVDLWAPFKDMSKAQIVKRGFELSVPFELTWSCYKGESLHCGKCGTCVERREAFALAGVEDPTIYSRSAEIQKKQQEKQNALAT